MKCFAFQGTLATQDTVPPHHNTLQTKMAPYLHLHVSTRFKPVRLRTTSGNLEENIQTSPKRIILVSSLFLAYDKVNVSKKL